MFCRSQYQHHLLFPGETEILALQIIPCRLNPAIPLSTFDPYSTCSSSSSKAGHHLPPSNRSACSTQSSKSSYWQPWSNTNRWGTFILPGRKSIDTPSRHSATVSISTSLSPFIFKMQEWSSCFSFSFKSKNAPDAIHATSINNINPTSPAPNYSASSSSSSLPSDRTNLEKETHNVNAFT